MGKRERERERIRKTFSLWLCQSADGGRGGKYETNKREMELE